MKGLYRALALAGLTAAMYATIACGNSREVERDAPATATSTATATATANPRSTPQPQDLECRVATNREEALANSVVDAIELACPPDSKGYVVGDNYDIVLMYGLSGVTISINELGVSRSVQGAIIIRIVQSYHQRAPDHIKRLMQGESVLIPIGRTSTGGYRVAGDPRAKVPSQTL